MTASSQCCHIQTGTELVFMVPLRQVGRFEAPVGVFVAPHCDYCVCMTVKLLCGSEVMLSH